MPPNAGRNVPGCKCFMTEFFLQIAFHPADSDGEDDQVEDPEKRRQRPNKDLVNLLPPKFDRKIST